MKFFSYLPPNIYIKLIASGEYGVFTSISRDIGSIVYSYQSFYWRSSLPTKLSLNIYDSNHNHVLSTKIDKNRLKNYTDTLYFSGFNSLVNHNCDNNIIYDIENNLAIATKNILPDEELTTNYLLYNWLQIPFICECGDEKKDTCWKNNISHLSIQDQLKLVKLLKKV